MEMQYFRDLLDDKIISLEEKIRRDQLALEKLKQKRDDLENIEFVDKM